MLLLTNFRIITIRILYFFYAYFLCYLILYICDFHWELFTVLFYPNIWYTIKFGLIIPLYSEPIDFTYYSINNMLEFKDFLISTLSFFFCLPLIIYDVLYWIKTSQYINLWSIVLKNTKQSIIVLCCGIAFFYWVLLPKIIIYLWQDIINYLEEEDLWVLTQSLSPQEYIFLLINSFCVLVLSIACIFWIISNIVLIKKK